MQAIVIQLRESNAVTERLLGDPLALAVIAAVSDAVVEALRAGSRCPAKATALTNTGDSAGGR